ncbi:hypothetical protein [Halobacterium noricense]|uniref:hypothetical protein n=1 Tax=Halobacterium noricense TaxID=223182 RepID=UPI001E4BD996|nr:hypothetical protein [Halobacterium noricense]UHH25178.1 hypothetical protein LT974_14510 [Halobacterium noricense]
MGVHSEVTPTMQRRKFIAGLGSLAAAGAAGIGTGAFTTVQANRSVSVSVADDTDALLALTPDPDDDNTNESENADYLSWNNGQVSINIDDAAGTTGSGVNANATTQINDLFKVVNQGTQAAVVYVDPDSISDSNYTFDNSGTGIMIDPQASNRPNGEYTNTSGLAAGVEDDQISLTGGDSGPTWDGVGSNNNDSLEEYVLGPGESFDFGLYVKTDDSVDDTSSISETIEIVADATRVPSSYTGDGSSS